MSTSTAVTVSNGIYPSLSDFRLTLQSDTPYSSADVTGASAATVYLTPCQSYSGVTKAGSGGSICLNNGTNWQIYTSNQLSYALSGTSTNTNYDVFLTSGLALEVLAWSGSTARATALDLQDSVLVKHGDVTRRYVGSFRTTGASNQTEDSGAQRYLFSHDNRVQKRLVCQPTANSWNYTLATLRRANADANNRVQLLRGLDDAPVWLTISVDIFNSAAAVNTYVAVGVDSATVAGADTVLWGGACPAAGFGTAKCFYHGFPGLGVHELAWLEASDAAGTTTFYGDNGGGLSKQSGMLGWCWA